jgi:hypothetical protein
VAQCDERGSTRGRAVPPPAVRRRRDGELSFEQQRDRLLATGRESLGVENGHAERTDGDTTVALHLPPAGKGAVSTVEPL